MQLISNYTKYNKNIIWCFYQFKLFRLSKYSNYGPPFVQTMVRPATFNCWVNEGELEKLSK